MVSSDFVSFEAEWGGPMLALSLLYILMNGAEISKGGNYG